MSTTSKRLSGKSALITGGNSGLGLATARLFVAEGARVAITDRNQKTLDAAAAELGDGRGKYPSSSSIHLQTAKNNN